MALTWDETVDLLKVVTAKDRRTIGEGDIRFWQAASAQAGWPSLAFAVAAVVRHTNDQPGVWFEPGHVTAYLAKVKSEVFQEWNPPAPPADLLDSPSACQQWANDQHHYVLSHALDRFSGVTTDDRVARIQQLKRGR